MKDYKKFKTLKKGLIVFLVAMFFVLPVSANIIVDNIDWQLSSQQQAVTNWDFSTWTNNVPGTWSSYQEPQGTSTILVDYCSSTSGWVAQSTWPNADVSIETGISLQTDGTRFYSGTIPANPSISNHGPVFVKTLTSQGLISDNLDLSVDVEHLYNYGYMGNVYVTLYDQNKERMFSVSIGDAWYQTRSDAVVYYWKSAAEGGGYVSQGVQKSGTWSGNLRVWYENGFIKGSVPGGYWTLCNPGQFTPSRSVYYVALSFGCKYSYSYQSKYIGHISLTKTGSQIVFYDDCSFVSGWQEQKQWPNPVVSIQTGIPIYSTSSKIYSGSIPADSSTYNHGPVFARALPRPMKLSNNLDLKVELEHIYTANKMGDVYVTLYDEHYERIFSVGISDAWYASRSDATITYYKSSEYGGGYINKYLSKTYGWVGTLRLYYENGAIKGSVPGASWTLCSQGQFDPNRVACVMTISFSSKQSYSYESKYVKDIQLTANAGTSSFSLARESSSDNVRTVSYSARMTLSGATATLYQPISQEALSFSKSNGGHNIDFSFWFKSSSSMMAQARIITSQGEYRSQWISASPSSGYLGWTQARVQVPASVVAGVTGNVIAAIAIAGTPSGVCYVDDARFGVFYSSGYVDVLSADSSHIKLGEAQLVTYIWQHSWDPLVDNHRCMYLSSAMYVETVGTIDQTFIAVDYVMFTTTLKPTVPVWWWTETTQYGSATITQVAECNNPGFSSRSQTPAIFNTWMMSAFSGSISKGIATAVGASTGAGILIGATIGTLFNIAKELTNEIANGPGMDYIAYETWEYQIWNQGHFGPDMILWTSCAQGVEWKYYTRTPATGAVLPWEDYSLTITGKTELVQYLNPSSQDKYGIIEISQTISFG